MKISVIIPVYNEEKTIEQVVRNVLGRPEVSEVIAVDDGSTDASRTILETLARGDRRLRAVPCVKNAGKGSAVQEALKHVTGDIVVIQDADLEYSPDDYPALISPFDDPKVQVVYGSRLMKKGNGISHVAFALGGILLTAVTNLLYGVWITDEPTGYKVFRAGVLKGLDLQSRGFEFCPEVTAKILRRGIRIREVPISYHPRTLSEGKKIRFRDGLTAIATLLRYRFTRAQ
ncbi:MAG: glycosyltransferase family 2 protein [Endomicrobiales bacterium]